MNPRGAVPPPPGSVAFYGSSSIRLWTTLASDFPDVPALNLGFGGSTLAACSWFYWRIVRPDTSPSTAAPFTLPSAFASISATKTLRPLGAM